MKLNVWFDDIDFKIEKPLLTRKVKFDQVKTRLIQASKTPGKVFLP